MPYTPLDHANFPATFGKISQAFKGKYDFNEDPQTYINDIKKVFKMAPLDDDVYEDIIGTGISQFSLKDVMRSPEEQKVYLGLRRQALDCFINELLGYEQAYAQLESVSSEEDMSTLWRYKTSLKTGGTDEDLQFNKDFLAACASKDPAALPQFQYKMTMDNFKELGINSPKDFARLYELSDEEFLKNHAQISRCIRSLAEYQYMPQNPHLTQEQKDNLTPYIKMAIAYVAVMERRLDIMANPLYSILDANRLYDKTFSMYHILGKMEDLREKVDFGKFDAAHHPLGVYFEAMEQLKNMNGDSLEDRIAAVYPEMKGAAFSQDKAFFEAFHAQQPVVVHTRDGQALVLTNSLHLKPQTVQEYSRKLTEEAVQADKWLLTGSKQFADMMKLSKEFDELQNSVSKTTQSQRDKANELAKAAEEYLIYKGIKIKDQQGNYTIEPDTLLHKGKNQREQSRLEAALKILQFARAEGASLKKVPEMEAAMAAEEKAARPAKIRSSLMNSATGKLDILNLVSALLPRSGPQVNIAGENGVKKRVDILPKQDLAALYALACGSDKVYYKTVINDPTDKTKQTTKTHTNEKSEETFNTMLQGVCSGQSGSDVKQNKMMTAAMSRVYHCLNSGNHKELGQILADGLKMNNKVMQAQKGFTPEFFVCAKLGEQALELMKKSPTIKAATEPFLSDADLQAAKAGAAISELHTKGVQAFGRLYQRFQMEDKELAFKGIEEDLANLCQMRGVGKELAGSKLNLANSDYGKTSNYASHINKGLAGNEPMTGFIKDLATKSLKEQIAEVKDPKKMTALYEDGIEKVLGTQKQQPQLQQPQLQLNVMQAQVQAQPQPEPVQAPQVPGSMG